MSILEATIALLRTLQSQTFGIPEPKEWFEKLFLLVKLKKEGFGNPSYNS
jgi:hypothetical protein